MIFHETIEAVKEERIRQIAKWGKQSHTSWYWLAVLVEEVGEIAKALQEGTKDDIKAEIIQVIAVCVAWLEYNDPNSLQ